MKNLDSHPSIQFLVQRLVHDAHAALPQRPEDAKLGEPHRFERRGLGKRGLCKPLTDLGNDSIDIGRSGGDIRPDGREPASVSVSLAGTPRRISAAIGAFPTQQATRSAFSCRSVPSRKPCSSSFVGLGVAVFMVSFPGS